MISRPQNFQSPIILDDAYEFAEAVGLSIAKDSPGGQLANSDIEAAWLSMSRYEKSQIPHVTGKSSVWEPREFVETPGEENQFKRLTAMFFRVRYHPTNPGPRVPGIRSTQFRSASRERLVQSLHKGNQSGALCH